MDADGGAVEIFTEDLCELRTQAENAIYREK